MLQRLLASNPPAERIAPALKTLLRGMRARYMLALLSVVVLSSVSYIGFTNIIEAQDQSAAVINMSGRQRMLSQRIPLLAQIIQETTREARRAELIADFENAVRLMELSHSALVFGDAKQGVMPLRSHAVREILFGSDDLLDNRISLFFQRAYMFAAQAKLPQDQDRLNDPTAELARLGGDILPALDRIVGILERESEEVINDLYLWQLGALSAMLIVVVLQGIVIFWPLDRELNRNFRLLLQSRERARKAQDEASRANRAKSEFLANMSHELRTPLNAINGFSELMMSEAFGPLGCAQYKGYTQDILSSGRHLLRFIDDILDIAQIESETVRLSEDIVNVHAILEETRSMFLSTASQDDIDIKIQDCVVPNILADGKRVRQVVINLVSNAVRFSKAGGEVILRAHWNGHDGVTIVVRDNGIGIHPDEQQSVMDPFVQIEEAYTRAHGGSGLGLTISNSLMKLHGGVMVIESTYGIGTEVRAHFPAARNLVDEQTASGSAVSGPEILSA